MKKTEIYFRSSNKERKQKFFIKFNVFDKLSLLIFFISFNVLRFNDDHIINIHVCSMKQEFLALGYPFNVYLIYLVFPIDFLIMSAPCSIYSFILKCFNALSTLWSIFTLNVWFHDWFHDWFFNIFFLSVVTSCEITFFLSFWFLCLFKISRVMWYTV